MSAEPKPSPYFAEAAEPFVWDGPGTVTYDEKTGFYSLEMTDEEYYALWDREVSDTLGMSGEEFLRKYDAGEYGETIDWPENWDALYFAMTRPTQTRPRISDTHE